MSLEKVKQTSRTLLLEEFNPYDPKVTDLGTLLKAEGGNGMSALNRRIKAELEVSTFREFVDKFTPTIYEYTVQDNDSGNGIGVKYVYSLEEKPGARKIEIQSNPYYKMLMEIYEDRAASGRSNLDPEAFKKIRQLLSPEAARDRARDIRKELDYVDRKLLELKDKPGAEYDRYRAKRKEIRKDIIRTYKDGLINLLPLAISDMQEKLKLVGIEDKSKTSGSSAPAQDQLPCRTYFDENGFLKIEQLDRDIEKTQEPEQADVEVISISENGTEKVISPGKPKNTAELIVSDYKQYGKNHTDNDFFANMLAEVYTGSEPGESRNSGLTVFDFEKIQQRKDLYTKLYKETEEGFVNAVSAVVEKMLGVMVFFDHALCGEKKLKAPLLVSNCRADKLLSEGVKDKFRDYITNMGRENSNEAIWFAIIPGAGDSDFTDVAPPDPNLDDPDVITMDDLEDGQSGGIMDEDGKKLVSLDSCKAMLDILKRGKITTFFNFKANKKTGFNSLVKDTVKKYMEKLESLNGNKYAVFAYPNFTLVPEEETTVSVGRTGRDGNKQDEYLRLPGVYIEAAYVAAGMVVASMDPSVLRKKGFKVNPQNACVRFDFEEGANRKIFTSRMAREGEILWEADAEELITDNYFGFCFCGNEIYHENKPLINSYVYLARTMDYDKNKYKPLYTTLTENFISKHIQADLGNRVRSNEAKKLVRSLDSKWKHEAAGDATKGYVNNIFHEDESIHYDDEENKIIIKFVWGDNMVDIKIEQTDE